MVPLLPGWDRVRQAFFDGHTFGDLVAQRRRPMVFIHASDMASLSRFEFNQRQFDLICSDLSQLPISVATASSAARRTA